jgi:hypothetical protein
MHKSVVEGPHSATEGGFVIQLQPDAEITRNVYFDFRIRIVQASKQSVVSSQPTAELVYENHVAVPASETILDAQFAIRENVLHIRARIKELSKAHRGQRFRLKVNFLGVTAFSNAIKVLSKSSIVKAHRTALSEPAPASASAVSASALPALAPLSVSLMTPQIGLPAPAPQAAAAPRAAAPAASVLGKRKTDDDAPSALLVEQRVLHADMQALRAEVRGLSDSVGALRDVLAAFFGIGIAPAPKALAVDPQHASSHAQAAELAAVASAALDIETGSEPHDPLRQEVYFRDMV